MKLLLRLAPLVAALVGLVTWAVRLEGRVNMLEYRMDYHHGKTDE